MPLSEEAWLHEDLIAQFAKFKRRTHAPHPNQEGVVAANCEIRLSQWSRPRVFINPKSSITSPPKPSPTHSPPDPQYKFQLSPPSPPC